MNVLRLIGIYLRVGVLNELEYRANFVAQLFESTVHIFAVLAQLAIVFSYTDRIAGWRAPEVVALVGIYTLVSGLIQMIVQPSMQRLMEDVRQGTLDFTLTKPEDSQVLVSMKQMEIWKFIDVVVGIVVIVGALLQMGVDFGPRQAALFLVALTAGGAIAYGFILILATTTFWFVRVPNILVIFQAMWIAGQWPLAIYPAWLRIGLTFVVPVAFATSVPAEALAGRLTLDTLAGSLLLAAALLVVSRWFWRVGVRHYSGASA